MILPLLGSVTVTGTSTSRTKASYFDDIHLGLDDLRPVREAALKHLEAALPVTGRAAVYTTSGKTQLDFNDDRKKIRETIRQIQPRPILRAFPDSAPIHGLSGYHLITWPTGSWWSRISRQGL